MELITTGWSPKHVRLDTLAFGDTFALAEKFSQHHNAQNRYMRISSYSQDGFVLGERNCLLVNIETGKISLFHPSTKVYPKVIKAVEEA